jgi:DNA-binding transcriptional LysR family regulator
MERGFKVDIRVLEEFVVYSKHLNLTKAARELHCSTATLSRHLNNLSKDLGSKLIIYDEESHNHKLTPAGRLALEGADKILAAQKSMYNHIRALEEPSLKSITIAYQAPIDQTATDLISLAQASFEKTPPPYVNFYSKRIAHRTALTEGKADIALLHDISGLEAHDYTAVPLFEDSAVALVHRFGKFA